MAHALHYLFLFLSLLQVRPLPSPLRALMLWKNR
jgi:hypothetical protein